MSRYVREGEVLGANELHRWAAEHGVVFLAHKASVLNRLCDDIVNIRLDANDSNIVLVGSQGVEGDI